MTDQVKSPIAVFSAPARYVQGPDATRRLGHELRYLGFSGPVLIVANRSARALLEESWQSTFEQAGMKYFVYPFGGQCTAEEVKKIEEVAKMHSADVIIGCGGGKVIDAARAAAASLRVGICSAPTLASSDAPCSALSVIYHSNGEVSEYRVFKRNPDLVLVDSSIIAKAPVRLLIAGMGDALATWFEGRTCANNRVKNMRGGASTMSALALAELCYKTLLAEGQSAIAANKTQRTNDSLEKLIEANTLLSGLGFESSGLAAAHAVHNGLTVHPGTRDYYHGEKVAFGVLTQLVLEGAPTHELDEVLNFSRQIGLPTTLRQIGIIDPTKSDLVKIAERTCQPTETIHNEPFRVDSKMVAEAIRQADAMGHF
jgi:glycerol dehydrogenase